ncbi:cell envelope integrity EipB family protein [Acuticoccus sp. M5D2P5]|uniref:EipB family protein n=1 Tax=Acuticoccus kalidii TaxID=2910977 RepID=UPI001F161994|nr:DUF1849 family protein [Acuticoccus kalidii]MCF3935761.1 cell envelope integrity EipB family protein [Acuticoccus kalidii]
MPMRISAGFSTRSFLASAAAAVVAIAAVAAPRPVWADGLLPHRAVYDISLKRAEAGASMVSVKGRLVVEISGGECEGYVVNSRFVTRVIDREGGQRTTDLRSSTFETLDPADFTFLNQTYVEDQLVSRVKGKAEAKADGVMVDITEPKETSISLGRAVFPSMHTRLILQAAKAGDRVLEAPVFDGGDSADEIYDTTTLIGPQMTGLPNASSMEKEALKVLAGAENADTWHLVISFFSTNGITGESVPDYQLTFTMLDNGVSYDVTFDHGTFALSGKLRELELRTPPDC